MGVPSLQGRRARPGGGERLAPPRREGGRPAATDDGGRRRLLAGFWVDHLRLGADCYSHRIPDAIWNCPESHKRSLLSGLWHGDGSWSYVSGGPRVVLEYGTVSRALADGMLRLLGELGIVARFKVARTAKSTVDTCWLVIAGADQIERVIELAKPEEHEASRASIARQTKRIALTGHGLAGDGTAWARVWEKSVRSFEGVLYSIEVEGHLPVVTTGGLIVASAPQRRAGSRGWKSARTATVAARPLEHHAGPPA